MDEQDESLIIAALVARKGGTVSISRSEMAELRSKRLRITPMIHDGSILIEIDNQPQYIDGEFRALEDQRT